MNSHLMASLALAAGLSMFAGVTVAESACKTMPQSTCEASSACTWVNGYTRKDGRAVAPYCRTLPPPKTPKGQAASAAPKSG